MDPQPGRPDRQPDVGDERKQNQDAAEQQQQVPVAVEVVGPPDQDQREGIEEDRDGRPPGLLGSEGVGRVVAGDDHVPDPVQQHDHRQHDGVGVWDQPPIHHVADDGQEEQDAQEEPEMGRDLGGAAQRRQHVERGDDHPPEHQQAQLGPSPGLGPEDVAGDWVVPGGGPRDGPGHRPIVAATVAVAAGPGCPSRNGPMPDPPGFAIFASPAAQPALIEPFGAGVADEAAELARRKARHEAIEAIGPPRYGTRTGSSRGLDFGARLLDLAEDDGVPLLERVKFMAIFAEMLDEFFQVRVSGLEDQVAAGDHPFRRRSPSDRAAAGHPRPRRAAGRPPGPDLPRPAGAAAGRCRGAAVGLVVARRRRPSVSGRRLPPGDVPVLTLPSTPRTLSPTSRTCRST